MEVSRLTNSRLNTDLLTTLTADSLFGSIGFARLWETMGGTPVYWAAFVDGEIVALLPGVEFGRRPLKRFQSMPDGIYSRILSGVRDNRARREMSRGLLQAVAKAGYVKTYITDFHGLMEVPETYAAQLCRTTIVDISDKDWRPPNRRLRRYIRKAEREGMALERFQADRHLEKFVSLMQATEQRHGQKPRYPVEFFAALAALAETDNRIIWYYCEHEGRPVVSHISFIDGDVALHWQLYYDKTFSFLRANQFMLWKLVGELRRRGVCRLSLGASPPGASGLVDYKAKWGGDEYTSNCYVHQSGLGRLL
jgi:hypothetical protein